jgi:hypothetical protein
LCYKRVCATHLLHKSDVFVHRISILTVKLMCLFIKQIRDLCLAKRNIVLQQWYTCFHFYSNYWKTDLIFFSNKNVQGNALSYIKHDNGMKIFSVLQLALQYMMNYSHVIWEDVWRKHIQFASLLWPFKRLLSCCLVSPMYWRSQIAHSRR